MLSKQMLIQPHWGHCAAKPHHERDTNKCVYIPHLHGQGALRGALVGRGQQEGQVRQAGRRQPLEQAALGVLGLGAGGRRRSAQLAAAEISSWRCGQSAVPLRCHPRPSFDGACMQSSTVIVGQRWACA